jgi:hypothetical protein
LDKQAVDDHVLETNVIEFDSLRDGHLQQIIVVEGTVAVKSLVVVRYRGFRLEISLPENLDHPLHPGAAVVEEVRDDGELQDLKEGGGRPDEDFGQLGCGRGSADVEVGRKDAILIVPEVVDGRVASIAVIRRGRGVMVCVVAHADKIDG